MRRDCDLIFSWEGTVVLVMSLEALAFVLFLYNLLASPVSFHEALT